MLKVNTSGVCTFCQNKKNHLSSGSYSLPVWYDDNNQVHYDLPVELQGLHIGEQMVIQKLSLYVPIQYLRYGQLCCTGHVCAFPQDIQYLCRVLPRLPEQVTRIRVVKKFPLAGDNGVGTKCFSIRKEKVLNALKWLKKYNKEYHDIIIEEKNLDWVGEFEESELPVKGDSFDKCIHLDENTNNSTTEDQGPSVFSVGESVSPDDGQSYGFFSET